MRRSSLVLLLAAVACNVPPRARPNWQTFTATRELQNEHQMTIDVQYGAGHFQLAQGERGELYRMRMQYDANAFTPLRQYDATTQTLRLGVESRRGAHISGASGDRKPSFDLALSPGLPLALNLEMGAVEADVDLGGLAVRRATFQTGASDSRLRFSAPNTADCEELTIEAGAARLSAEQLANSNCTRVGVHGGVGDLTLDFGGAWKRSMTADINVGVGSLHLRLPRDVGVSVHLNRFLASFDATGFQKRADSYVSSNFDAARTRLVMNVNASIGGVNTEWIGN